MAADEKYPFPNRHNLTIANQMQLSPKEKMVYQFFTPFLKSRWYLSHFNNKDDLHRFCNFDYGLRKRGHINV